MNIKMFSIFDAKAGSFAQPFFAFNEAVAQRNVAIAVRDGTSLLAKFPADYQLYLVGEFDDGTGEVTPMRPVVVCNLISLREVVHAS